MNKDAYVIGYMEKEGADPLLKPEEKVIPGKPGLGGGNKKLEGKAPVINNEDDLLKHQVRMGQLQKKNLPAYRWYQNRYKRLATQKDPKYVWDPKTDNMDWLTKPKMRPRALAAHSSYLKLLNAAKKRRVDAAYSAKRKALLRPPAAKPVVKPPVQQKPVADETQYVPMTPADINEGKKHTGVYVK